MIIEEESSVRNNNLLENFGGSVETSLPRGTTYIKVLFFYIEGIYIYVCED
jgi:hypothetical protein